MSKPAAAVESAPLRAIGLGGAILIAANGMVASGIFSLPGKLDAAVGTFAPLLVLTVAAFMTFGTGHAPVLPPVRDSAGVALVALYAFTGFEVGSLAAGETSNPRRALPIALVGTVIVIGLLYVLVQWAYSASGTPNGDAPLVALAVRIGGAGAGLALGLTVLVSVVGGITVAILGGSRMTVGMAEEQMLPARFASFSTRFTTPVFSILFFGLFALLLAVSGSFVFLAVVSTLARLLSYFACILAAPRLDRQFAARRAWPRRLALPAIAAALCLWAASQSSAREWRSLAALVAVGAVLYVIAARKDPWLKPSPPPIA